MIIASSSLAFDSDDNAYSPIGSGASPRYPRHLGEPAETVKTIDFEADFIKLMASASTYRDRLLLSALYDLGLRIGQALGFRHSDLAPMRRQVRICRREDNENGALSKQRV